MTTPNRFQVNNAIGRLTRNPELVWLENGNYACRMRVAIDRMGRDGQAGYINVASFGKAGEAAAEHLSAPVSTSGVGGGRRRGRGGPGQWTADRSRTAPAG
jgi:hypothetical protein